ncbi:uncharacterized protein RHIMIDRAFT_295562 [Rhizopus microsporus ATCC 52813]|uniref:Uncharacterized protein n=1 Tax=Rhizopus microsporus ATCC 52813 TaxID=1340429 RepID=A0A2G4SGD9_RHIZD|nr:uncharacterized protein RHIMIDRAFT_295562 [Rhizopus microsporus ATCC 52813]PHZ07830.1 hypothetical protein RHIMIDRAFT_295562 [Rhizopus microsporus ATCC 52813]
MLGSTKGDKVVSIPGRSDLHGQVATRIPSTHRTDYSSGFHHREQQDVTLATRQESSLDSQDSLQPPEEDIGLMDSLGPLCGDSARYISRQSTSTLSHEAYGIPVESLLASTPMSLESEDQTRTRMVDYTAREMEWTAYPDTSTYYSSFYGCLKSRLGHRFQPTWTSMERRLHINIK